MFCELKESLKPYKDTLHSVYILSWSAKSELQYKTTIDDPFCTLGALLRLQI